MIRWIIYRWEGYMKLSGAQKKEVGGGDSWNGFRLGSWSNSIDVRDFIVRNVKPFPGSEDFLAGPSQRTMAVWAKLQPSKEGSTRS